MKSIYQFLKEKIVYCVCFVVVAFSDMLRWMEAIPSVIRALSAIEAVFLYSATILIVIHAL